MTLTYDPKTSKISYQGREIGSYEYIDKDRAKVTFCITYECSPHDWIVPLSHFDTGLHLIDKKPLPLLIVTTSEDDIEETYPVKRLLLEVTIKQNGYKWRFHKNDPDQWPSELHAHDYDQRLTLDALNGLIYDTATRQVCKKMKTSALKKLQEALLQSKDFCEPATQLIGR